MEIARPKLSLLKGGEVTDREKAHPTPDELVAYHARTLADDHNDQVQEHLALCRECTQMVMQLSPAGSSLRRLDPISDEHVSEAWERFVSQLAAEHTLDSPTRRRSRHWAAGLAAIAAVLTVTIGAALFSLWTLQGLEQEQPAANVNLIYPELVEPMRSENIEPPPVVPDFNGSILVLNPRAPFARYSAEIEGLQDASTRILWSTDDLIPSKIGELTVIVPRGYLPQGTYRIRLFGFKDDQKEFLDVYRFSLGAPIPPAGADPQRKDSF